MARIFISYAKHDTYALAVQIRDALREIPGIIPWMDEFLEEGQSWAAQIQTEIRQCDLMIVLLSPDVNRDAASEKGISFVINEIEYAQRLRKPIIPVMAQQTDPPVQIVSLQYVDFTRNPASGMQKLLTRVTARLGINSPSSASIPASNVDSQPLIVSAKTSSLSRYGIIGVAFLFVAIVAFAILSSLNNPSPATLAPAATTEPVQTTLSLTPNPASTQELTPSPDSSTPPAVQTASGFQPTPSATASLTGVIIGSQNAVLRSGPSTNNAAVKNLVPGTQVVIIRIVGDGAWYNVRIEDGTEGYVASSLVSTPQRSATATATFLPTANAEALTLAQTPIVENSQWNPVMQTFDGIEMVLVPKGCFEMGADSLAFDTRSQGVPSGGDDPQCIEQPFWLDRTEVTNDNFNLVTAESSHVTYPDYPRDNINWFEARDYCESRGGRLPTEAEWEYAARGPDNLAYPWGSTFDEAKIVFLRNARSQPASVASRIGGVSWVGAVDMSGNVWEWVSSLYQSYPYDASHEGQEDDRDRTDIPRVLRGGSWAFDEFVDRAASRNGVYPNNAVNDYGVRCARDFDS